MRDMAGTEPRARMRPIPFVFGGLSFAGVFLLMTAPGAGPEPLALFAAGLVASGLLATFATPLRALMTMRAGRLAWTASCALVAVAALLAATRIVPTAPVACAGSFVCGSGLPFGFSLWAQACAPLNLRAILSGVGASFVPLSGAVALGETLGNPGRLAVAALCMAVGSTSALLAPRRLKTGEASGTEVYTGQVRAPLSAVLLSTPVSGLALFAFTASSADPGSDRSAISPLACCVLGILVVALVRLVPARYTERTLSYTLFNLALPALAIASLLLKIIPLDQFSVTSHGRYMHLFFQVTLLAFIAYLFDLAHASGDATLPGFFSPFAVVGISLLAGRSFGIVGGDIKMAALGIVTALFLLLAGFTLARAYALFATRHVAPSAQDGIMDDEPASATTTVEDACAKLTREASLSPRESEVLVELAYGHTSGYIAKALFISDNTVRTHMRNIYRKLGVTDREALLELVRHRR